jgi:hypothetical protein
MKVNGFSDFFLQVKGLFGDLEEPVVKRRDPDWKPREVFIEPRVSCTPCKHFSPSTSSPAGLGRCQSSSPSSKKYPPFPYALRHCSFYGE